VLAKIDRNECFTVSSLIGGPWARKMKRKKNERNQCEKRETKAAEALFELSNKGA
jgi:hypothetical protein